MERDVAHLPVTSYQLPVDQPERAEASGGSQHRALLGRIWRLFSPPWRLSE
jgi:hypothetical protein